MLRVGIEFRPYGNHEASAHGVERIQHPFRVRISAAVELMAAPLVVLPIPPVLHDVVHRNTFLPHFCQCPEYILLRSIALAALPVAHCPFRHYLGLSGDGAVAADYFVNAVSGNDIIVDLSQHLAPPVHPLLHVLRNRAKHPQSAVGYISVRLPFYSERYAFPRFKSCLEFPSVRVPCGAPYLWSHRLSVDKDPGIACIIYIEMVKSCF